MSTILRALQKNKLGQQSVISGSKKTNSTWRIMVLLGIFLIVFLLSALLYIRLTPIVEPEIVTIKPVLKPISKIVFQTQEMPETKQTQKVIYIAKQPDKKHSKQIVIPIKKEPTKKIESAEELAFKEQQKEAKKEQQEIEDVSEKMKQQFALAVSLTDDEDEVTDNNLTINSDGLESSDGSDIRDMSSHFQQSVPAMSYESHVYSSISENCWIKINGETLKEGDFDRTGQLEVVDIQPQRTVFRQGAQSFSLESLVDWEGL